MTSRILQLTKKQIVGPLRNQIRFISNGNSLDMEAQQPLKPGESLDKFGIDLTDKASKGHLDPVIGIENLIRTR
jgi:ATP-dependent Clp protease ATP-binding subunit ClpA